MFHVLSILNVFVKTAHTQCCAKVFRHLLFPSVKLGGGSVVVCVCISAGAVEELVKVDGMANFEKLIQHVILSGKSGNSFIFQHGNDPKHTDNAVEAYLDRNTYKVTLLVVD